MASNQGQLTEFGILFSQHYGMTSKDNCSLYERERRYYKRHGHVSWDENGNPLPRGPGGKASEFGKLFFQHYGITKKDNSNLYAKEIMYLKNHGHVSWDETGNPLPKFWNTPEGHERRSEIMKNLWETGRTRGNTGNPAWNRGMPSLNKIHKPYKKHNKKEQNTMTIKDYANQLKTKFDSVSANWNKLTIEQLEQIENCLNLVVKPVVVPQPAPVKKRTRKFKGFSQKVQQQKAEYQYDVSNGYTGKYREWLKIKKAGGTIYTNKIQ